MMSQEEVGAVACRRVLMTMLHLPWAPPSGDWAQLTVMNNEQIAEAAVIGLADGPIVSVEARGVVELLLAILNAPSAASRRLFDCGEIHAWAVALGQRRMEVVELKERVARLESQLNGRG